MSDKWWKVAPPASGNDDDLSSGNVIPDDLDDAVTRDVAEVVVVDRLAGDRHVTWNEWWSSNHELDFGETTLDQKFLTLNAGRHGLVVD